jgi:hypothetical protein
VPLPTLDSYMQSTPYAEPVRPRASLLVVFAPPFVAVPFFDSHLDSNSRVYPGLLVGPLSPPPFSSPLPRIYTPVGWTMPVLLEYALLAFARPLWIAVAHRDPFRFSVCCHNGPTGMALLSSRSSQGSCERSGVERGARFSRVAARGATA